MKWLYKLERRFGRLGVPNLMIYVTATMLLVFCAGFIFQLPAFQFMAFSRSLILQGQLWRLITFAFLPPSWQPLWLIIGLYFYYFIGSSLEDAWSPFLFTAYYCFGIIGAIAAGFIGGTNDNTYLNMSLFFAFAQLFPNYQVLLFFFIPIKVKYLAYLNWAFFLYAFVTGTFAVRVSILFSLLNFFIFFGPDFFKRIRENIRYSKRRRDFRKQMNQNKNMWG